MRGEGTLRCVQRPFLVLLVNHWCTTTDSQQWILRKIFHTRETLQLRKEKKKTENGWRRVPFLDPFLYGRQKSGAINLLSRGTRKGRKKKRGEERERKKKGKGEDEGGNGKIFSGSSLNLMEFDRDRILAPDCKYKGWENEETNREWERKNEIGEKRNEERRIVNDLRSQDSKCYADELWIQKTSRLLS